MLKHKARGLVHWYNVCSASIGPCVLFSGQQKEFIGQLQDYFLYNFQNFPTNIQCRLKSTELIFIR